MYPPKNPNLYCHFHQFICCKVKNPDPVPVPEGITCTAPALWFTARNKIRQPGLLLTALYCHWMQSAEAFLCFYLYLPPGAGSSRLQALRRGAFGRVPRWVLVSSIPTHGKQKGWAVHSLPACCVVPDLSCCQHQPTYCWGFGDFFLPPPPRCCLHALLELGRVWKEEGNQHPSTGGVIKKKKIRRFSNRKIWFGNVITAVHNP